MNADMYKSLQRSWALARKRRAVDKKGLAVALIFVVAMCFWIRECSNKTTEQVSNASQEQPDLPAEIQIRSAGSIPREAEFSWPGESMTGVSNGVLPFVSQGMESEPANILNIAF